MKYTTVAGKNILVELGCRSDEEARLLGARIDRALRRMFGEKSEAGRPSDKLEEAKRTIKELLGKGATLTYDDLTEVCGVSRPTVKRALVELGAVMIYDDKQGVWAWSFDKTVTRLKELLRKHRTLSKELVMRKLNIGGREAERAGAALGVIRSKDGKRVIWRLRVG